MARFSGAAYKFGGTVAVAAALALVTPAHAQQDPSVTVDMSVLDELGPPEPGASGERIQLRPPESSQPRQQAAPEPTPRPEPSPQPEETAATPAPRPEAVPEPEPTSPAAAEESAAAPAEPEPEPAPTPDPDPDPESEAAEAAPEPEAIAPEPEEEAAAPEPEPEAAEPESMEAESQPAPEPEQSASEPAEPQGEAEAETAADGGDAESGSAEPPTQSAALTPNDEGDPSLRVQFGEESAELPGSANAGLAELVRVMSGDDAKRLVIYAYADGEGKTESQARRLSLSRALAVRRYLVENGIRGTRAEIRALGQQTDEEPIDRVDLVVVER